MGFLQDPALVLDILVALLLVATIGYAAVLNRKLSNLRANRAEMEQAINDLTQASLRADQSAKGLKAVAREAEADLNAGLGKAQGLRDELAFLVERGERVAERVSQTPSSAAAAPSGGRAQPDRSGTPGDGRRPPPSEVLSEDRSVPAPVRGGGGVPARGPSSGDRPMEGRSTEGRSTEGRSTEGLARGGEDDDLASVASKAERDLMRALKDQRG